MSLTPRVPWSWTSTDLLVLLVCSSSLLSLLPSLPPALTPLPPLTLSLLLSLPSPSSLFASPSLPHFVNLISPHLPSFTLALPHSDNFFSLSLSLPLPFCSPLPPSLCELNLVSSPFLHPSALPYPPTFCELYISPSPILHPPTLPCFPFPPSFCELYFSLPALTFRTLRVKYLAVFLLSLRLSRSTGGRLLIIRVCRLCLRLLVTLRRAVWVYKS